MRELRDARYNQRLPLGLYLEVSVGTGQVGLACTRKDGLERRYHGGVELGSSRLREAETRYTAGHRISVRPTGCHGVVGIRNRNDSRHNRDLVSVEAVRVAIAVHPLVMVAYDSGDLGVVVNLAENALANRRMLLHPTALLESERSGLLQKSGGESYLADVVH